jgi:hypothetical protein
MIEYRKTLARGIRMVAVVLQWTGFNNEKIKT